MNPCRTMIRIDLSKIGHGLRFSHLKSKEIKPASKIKGPLLISFLILVSGILVLILGKDLNDVVYEMPATLSDKTSALRSSVESHQVDTIDLVDSLVSSYLQEEDTIANFRLMEPNPLAPESNQDKLPGFPEYKYEENSDKGSHWNLDFFLPEIESSFEQKASPNNSGAGAREKSTDYLWRQPGDIDLAEMGDKPFYSVHISSFKTMAEAESDMKGWQNLGYKPFIRLTTVPLKGNWYRVYIGRFPNWITAMKFAEKLKQREGISYVMPDRLKPQEFR